MSEPRVRDFRQPRWGFVFEIWSRAGDGTITAMGYGPRPDVGDVVAVYAGHGDRFLVREEQALEVPEDTLLFYRVTESSKAGRNWPRDRFECKATRELGFRLDDSGEIVEATQAVEELRMDDESSPPSDTEGVRKWLSETVWLVAEAFGAQRDCPGCRKVVRHMDRRELGTRCLAHAHRDITVASIKKLRWPLGIAAPPFSGSAAEWNAVFPNPVLVAYWPTLDEDVALFTQTVGPATEDSSGLLTMINLKGIGEVSLSRVLVRHQHLVFGVEPEGGWIEQVVYVKTPTYTGLARCDDESMDEYGTLPGDGEPPADYDYDDEEQPDDHARLSDSWVVYPITLGVGFEYFCVRSGSMRATTKHEQDQYDWRVAGAAKKRLEEGE